MHRPAGNAPRLLVLRPALMPPSHRPLPNPPAAARMYAPDRVAGNTAEWGLIFLPLYWIAMILTDGACATWGWM